MKKSPFPCSTCCHPWPHHLPSKTQPRALAAQSWLSFSLLFFFFPHRGKMMHHWHITRMGRGRRGKAMVLSPPLVSPSHQPGLPRGEPTLGLGSSTHRPAPPSTQNEPSLQVHLSSFSAGLLAQQGEASLPLGLLHGRGRPLVSAAEGLICFIKHC